MRDIQEQLQAILTFGQGETFLSFANADGKRWLMPERGMRTAMLLYQPSGWKGKGLKRVLPGFYWNPWVRGVLHAERLRLSLSEELRKLLEHTLGEAGLEFAVFCGTPSARQKITIQVSKRKRILGYCKITQSEAIYDLFERENKMLSALSQYGIPNIPKPLYCGQLGKVYIFVQTTYKTRQSKVVHIWTAQHEYFLNLLSQRTRRELSFKATDFYRELVELSDMLDLQPKDDKALFERAISILEVHYASIKEYACFHGDFTPWNMFFEKDLLCVFDFEYAQESFPPGLDKLHYLLQVWIIEKKLNSEQIFSRLEDLRGGNQIELLSVIAYLMHILAFYIKLYQGYFNPNDNGYVIWTQLLNKYVKIYERQHS